MGLTGVRDGAGAVLSQYAYDPNGNRTLALTRKAGRGVALRHFVIWANERQAPATSTRRFQYDDAGRLTGVRDGTGAVLSHYAYDPNGNRTLALTRGVRHELGLDIGCDPTAAGTLTTAADFQDRLCRYGDYHYTYDDNGQLTQKRHVSDVTDVTTYSYAGDGRLLRVTLPAGGATIDYLHDAQGRRIARIVDGALERGWLYKDSINPIAQLDATGAVEATFVYGTRPHVPDFMVQSDGTVLRYVTNHLGSVRALVNVATGDVVERMDYDAWGVVTAAGGTRGAWSTQPFGYAGGMYDAATGLVRFGVRDYDAETGRWTAKEPLGFAAETNFYQYAGNDPTNRIDPTGRIWWLVVGGLAAAAATGLASDRSGDPNSSPFFPVEVATAGLSGPVARVAGAAAKKLLPTAITAIGARMCGGSAGLPSTSGGANQFGMHIYQWAGGGRASFTREGARVVVDYLRRGGAPSGEAGSMLANSIRAAGGARPTELFAPNILQKAANSNAVIESSLRQAAHALGGRVTGVSRGIDAGNHWIRVTLGY